MLTELLVSICPLLRTYAQLIQQLEGDLVAFRGCVDAIGTPHDSLQNRDQLKELRSRIIPKISDCQQKLAAQKKLSDPQSKITFDRLSRQLNSLLDQFNDLMEKEKTSARKHSVLVASGEREREGDRQRERGRGSTFMYSIVKGYKEKRVWSPSVSLCVYVG